ncbi:2'-5' RNA ligase family protein [Rhizobium bangladeshense]|uniref:2'-5' RNA ligase family protein n=1 Tax=Rhizobium bangladeshense TaxID=1138189 RepID=UPI001A994D8D|nr:2'-5' RNA ligase family protein [Rhizobium bangladeshense]MBX4930604.1 2'-5' RNA ligase family protein [Rhizobium bangladeshense]QSY87169.1 2'-5' RNA ligase family protein [Rhizobium bangladeshense]
MPYGISLKCLNDTASSVFKLWDEAAAFEEAASMRALHYPPHITLAVYQEIAIDRLAEAAERVFRVRPAVTSSFSGIGYFENELLILWARPNYDEQLFQLHAELHREVDPAHCHAHYRPGNWVPHCTIATKIPRAKSQAAINWANRNRMQFSVTFDAADCVRFPPVEVLSQTGLASQ